MMVDQDDYNKEYDDLVKKHRNEENGIRLLNFRLDPLEIEIPDEPLDIDMEAGKLKPVEKINAVVKEFKPNKKTNDEPIW